MKLNLKKAGLIGLMATFMASSFFNPAKVSADEYKTCFVPKPKQEIVERSGAEKFGRFLYNSTIGIIPNTFRDIGESRREIQESQKYKMFSNPQDYGIKKDSELEKVFSKYGLPAFGITKAFMGNYNITVLSMADEREPLLAGRTIIYPSGENIAVYPLDPEEKGMKNSEKVSTLEEMAKKQKELCSDRNQNFLPYVVKCPICKEVKEIGWIFYKESDFPAITSAGVTAEAPKNFDAMVRLLVTAGSIGAGGLGGEGAGTGVITPLPY